MPQNIAERPHGFNDCKTRPMVSPGRNAVGQSEMLFQPLLLPSRPHCNGQRSIGSRQTPRIEITMTSTKR